MLWLASIVLLLMDQDLLLMSDRPKNRSIYSFLRGRCMDVFAEVLRAIRLKGSVYFNACFCSPWGMAIEQEKKASFHLIVAGDAWLSLGDNSGEQIKLSEGDIVLFPKGSPHSISDQPGGKCIEGSKVVEAYQAGSSLFKGDQQVINIICGYVEF
jgi:mannose-6-phosphate isomerase-like protein (cupin superfamily)